MNSVLRSSSTGVHSTVASGTTPPPQFTCTVCNTSRPMSQIASLTSCAHLPLICRECLGKDFSKQVVDGRTPITCPVALCGAPVKDKELKSYVDAALYARFISRRALTSSNSLQPNIPIHSSSPSLTSNTTNLTANTTSILLLQQQQQQQQQTTNITSNNTITATSTTTTTATTTTANTSNTNVPAEQLPSIEETFRTMLRFRPSIPSSNSILQQPQQQQQGLQQQQQQQLQQGNQVGGGNLSVTPHLQPVAATMVSNGSWDLLRYQQQPQQQNQPLQQNQQQNTLGDTNEFIRSLPASYWE